MHSKPMTTEGRGKKGLLARHGSGACSCVGSHPCTVCFLKARLLFHITTVPGLFPTSTPENQMG